MVTLTQRKDYYPVAVNDSYLILTIYGHLEQNYNFQTMQLLHDFLEIPIYVILGFYSLLQSVVVVVSR